MQDYLRDLNTQMGPTGTNEIRVIFYEGDAATTDMADLARYWQTTPKVDWITGAPTIRSSMRYPLHIESEHVCWPLGFPTINVIRPGDREITADIWDQNLAGKWLML
jgi:hypothetical protein